MFSIYSRYQFFIGYMALKYFLPVYSLFFHLIRAFGEKILILRDPVYPFFSLYGLCSWCLWKKPWRLFPKGFIVLRLSHGHIFLISYLDLRRKQAFWNKPWRVEFLLLSFPFSSIHWMSAMSQSLIPSPGYRSRLGTCFWLCDESVEWRTSKRERWSQTLLIQMLVPPLKSFMIFSKWFSPWTLIFHISHIRMKIIIIPISQDREKRIKYYM